MQIQNPEGLISWANNQEGTQVLTLINSEIEKIQQDLTNGSLLTIKDPYEFMKNYSTRLGQLHGLNTIKDIVKLVKQNQDRERQQQSKLAI